MRCRNGETRPPIYVLGLVGPGPISRDAPYEALDGVGFGLPKVHPRITIEEHWELRLPIDARQDDRDDMTPAPNEGVELVGLPRAKTRRPDEDGGRIYLSDLLVELPSAILIASGSKSFPNDRESQPAFTAPLSPLSLDGMGASWESQAPGGPSER